MFFGENAQRNLRGKIETVGRKKKREITKCPKARWGWASAITQNKPPISSPGTKGRGWQIKQGVC